MSTVRKARECFENGNYNNAIQLYRKLEILFGKRLFQANIEICERRLSASKRETRLNVVFIADENFALPTYVAVYSLIRNKSKITAVDLFVMSVRMSTESVAAIKSLQRSDVSITIIDVPEDYSQFSIQKEGFHVSTAAIVKFQLPTLLSELEKVLYIDGDVIVNGDLSRLYDVQLDGLYAAVVKDIKPTHRYKPSILEKLKIKSHRYYFNSGMMLLNLQKIREDLISDALLEYRRSGINYFMDQDALNVVFGDKVEYVSYEHNLLTTLPEEFSIREIVDEYGACNNISSFLELRDSAAIIHFASKRKPWKHFVDNDFYIWNRYYISSRAFEQDNFQLGGIPLKSSINDIVVSVTTYPARIDTVHQTLESIITQTFRPGLVVLWLAQEEFPEGESSLPATLLKLKEIGLHIRWTHNIKSYKKLIPALKAYPDKVIVTADDDIIYKPSWLERLVASYIQHPHCIHCHRAHKVKFDSSGSFAPYKKWSREIKDSTPSFNTFFTGCGGVLYPPHSLHVNVINENDFTQLCESGDDIWFWGMAVMNKTKIRVVPDNDFSLEFTPDSQNVALWKVNDSGGRNDEMLDNLLARFPAIHEIAHPKVSA